jgi:hypothetical protein
MGSKLNDPIQKEKEILPGPGHFYPTIDVVKPKNPGYSMRTIVNRPATDLEKNPGPGSYLN